MLSIIMGNQWMDSIQLYGKWGTDLVKWNEKIGKTQAVNINGSFVPKTCKMELLGYFGQHDALPKANGKEPGKILLYEGH